MRAGGTTARTTSPSVSTSSWRVRPVTGWPPASPRRPPTPVVFTACLSLRPALSLRIPPQAHAPPLTPRGVPAHPCPLHAPASARVGAALPRRPFLRQEAPGPAAAQLGAEGSANAA